MRLLRIGLVLPLFFAASACGTDEDEAVGHWVAEGLSETEFVLTEEGDFVLKTEQHGMCTGDWNRDGAMIQASCSFGDDEHSPALVGLEDVDGNISTRLRLEDEGSGPSVLVGDDATDPVTDERRFVRTEQ